ncbi:glutaredoxin family protein [Hydrogenophaga sp.]|uniref:glutaredoxin family protein n=1 Tax=Hydrogenophaga sp. TaxID=1904254 RepID=UPI00262C23F6|nr:glutaredoxin family protein [Hydrogenophaga sp.]MCW5654658.1 glutaredoxin family protein [Hydrogenophaga sp.]
MNVTRPAFAFLPRLLGLGLLTGLLAAPVLAQGVYRIVGPDGRVTFSDQPPPAGQGNRPAAGAASGPAPAASAQLPYELRQISSRFPVTLYSSRDCAPCNSGRNLLNARGIPYVEKTIDSAQDTEALQRLSGDTSLPFLTIGGQQIKGYSDTEWTKFLDAAGYPKQSALPSSYRRPAPSPLVAVQTEAAGARGAAPASTPPAQQQAPAAEPAPPNPAGIRF